MVAVLSSSQYRRRYSEFLKTDYPRVPTTSNYELFCRLAALGRDLIAAELLRSSKSNSIALTLIGQKNQEVRRVGWLDDTVWLDAGRTSASEGHRATKRGTVGFLGVSEEVWDFHIGGYQVCHKWLKDRRGRTLGDEEVAHYQKIVAAVNETIRIMAEIDEVIKAHGGWPAAFRASGPAEGRRPALLRVAESSPPYGRGGPEGVSDDRP